MKPTRNFPNPNSLPTNLILSRLQKLDPIVQVRTYTIFIRDPDDVSVVRNALPYVEINDSVLEDEQIISALENPITIAEQEDSDAYSADDATVRNNLALWTNQLNAIAGRPNPTPADIHALAEIVLNLLGSAAKNIPNRPPHPPKSGGQKPQL